MRGRNHARLNLPAGYQFGDAGSWRRPSANAAEELERRAGEAGQLQNEEHPLEPRTRGRRG